MAVDDLTTFTKVRNFIGAKDTDSNVIEPLITSASSWANKYTSRKLKARDYDGTDDDSLLDGDNTDLLLLPQYPINSITNIYQDSQRVFGTDTLLTTDDYLVYNQLGKIIAINTLWYGGFRTIKIVYNAGYDEVPLDLENAIVSLVDYWNKAFKDHRFGISSTTTGDISINYEKDIPNEIRGIVGLYKKVAVF